MKECQILFNGPMVRAILERRKTQTRRVCRLQPHDAAGMVWWPDGAGTDTGTSGGAPGIYLKKCPYGELGDRLWVREAFAYSVIDPEGLPPEDDPENYDIIYRSTYQQGGWWTDGEGNAIKAPWKPSIHMPRWASRITLEITGVRVERLQDISEEDARSEGIAMRQISNGDPRTGCRDVFGLSCDDNAWASSASQAYKDLWESIKGPGSWESNPWVWVVEFKRVSES